MTRSPDKRTTPCPGCGKPRKTKRAEAFCNGCRKGTGELGQTGMEWMLDDAARIREAAPSPYAVARAARKPWISIQEAAFELNVSEGRISQLISAGALLARKDPDRARAKQVDAAEVYAYQPAPGKKRTRAA